MVYFSANCQLEPQTIPFGDMREKATLLPASIINSMFYRIVKILRVLLETLGDNTGDVSHESIGMS